MAYQKLTQSVLTLLETELAAHLHMARVWAAYGEKLGVFSVRGICKKVGISHTTYYRWLRAYRALVGARGPFTERQKLLCKFGEIVDQVQQEVSIQPAQQHNILAVLAKEKSSVKRDELSSEPLQAAQVSDCEKRTDALSKGVGFKTFRFTK